jgi:hypothetical protein
MKVNIVKGFMIAAVLTMAFSCRDKETEKRIAELESQIADLKGQKTASNPTAVTPGVQTVAPGQQAAAAKPEGPLPVAQFAKTEHDFGTINEGQTVEYTFAFKNTGAAPLIIQDAKPSCGCTVPNWSKDPIPPGASGFVRAKFDSNGKPGIQNKTITVTANTYPKQTVLRFKAMVTPKANAAETGPVK